MMTAIFTAMIVVGFLFGAATGRMQQVSAAAMGEAQRAVELVFSLTGAYCLWGGMMEIAQEAGLTRGLAKLASPITKRLFKGINPKGPAMGAISMNLAANLLGLGNAATPLGITAMRELEIEERSKDSVTNNMALFVVMNTASLQLIPTTTAMLRSAAGAKVPLDILPAVWMASAVSIVAGITAAKLLGKVWR